MFVPRVRTSGWSRRNQPQGASMPKTATKPAPVLDANQLNALCGQIGSLASEILDQLNRVHQSPDKVGLLKAVISPLEEVMKEHTNQLKDQGVGTYNGTLYSVNVHEQEREVLDMKAVRAKLS